MWGQKALLTASFAQRKSAHVAPTICVISLQLGVSGYKSKRSVLVARDIKSPLREKQRK